MSLKKEKNKTPRALLNDRLQYVFKAEEHLQGHNKDRLAETLENVCSLDLNISFRALVEDFKKHLELNREGSILIHVSIILLISSLLSKQPFQYIRKNKSVYLN